MFQKATLTVQACQDGGLIAAMEIKAKVKIDGTLTLQYNSYCVATEI